MTKILFPPLTLVVLAIVLSVTAYAQTCPGSPDCIVPTFEAARNFAVPGEVDQVVTGDFNNDGKPDMATTGSAGTYVLLGDGTGNVSAPALVNATPSRVIITGDFNGDGNPDLVNGGSQVFLGNGPGGFSSGPTLGLSTTRGLAVADFNHDGKLDLVIPVTGASQFSIQYGDGAGGFSSTMSVIIPYNDPPTFGMGTVAVGDFNGDGSIDIALPVLDDFIAETHVVIFLNDSSGNFPSENETLFGNDVVVGDFNHDGNLDLAGPCRFCVGVIASLGDGTGSYIGPSVNTNYWLDLNEVYDGPTLANWLPRLPASYFPHFAVADFNFDGVSDLAMKRSQSDTITIFSYSGGQFNPIGGTDFSSESVSGISAADFNLDGKPDIAAANSQDGTVSVYINNTLLPTAATHTGSNVAVQTIGGDLTFSNVSSAGTTSVTSIDPATAGDIPGGFAVADIAFEVTTTATFSGSVTSCFNVTTVDNENDFDSLRVLHLEGTTLVDRTSSHDFSNLKICATTTSLSPFYLATINKKIRSLFDRSKAFKSGSTVPVKVQVLNGSDQNVSASNLSLNIRGLQRIGSSTASIVTDAGNSNPDYIFRYDSDLQGYIYNLKTTGLAAGKYVLSFYAGSDRTFFYTVTFDVR